MRGQVDAKFSSCYFVSLRGFKLTMLARLRHLWLALITLPALLFDAHRRRLFAEMRTFARGLPAALSAPLPQALATLTPPTSNLQSPISVSTLRRLADLTALLGRRSPLGLCLRRSLVRYHFLRRAGLPLVLNFGARFKSGQPDREITGHAWVTLHGQPYFEDGENYRGFTGMLQYPPVSSDNLGVKTERLERER